MGKSLKEALAEQMTALRARGIAPELVPDGEAPEVALPTNGYDTDERPRRMGKRALSKRSPRAAAPRGAIPKSRPGRAATEAAPPQVVPRPPSIGKMLQHRAEERRKETEQHEALRQQLSTIRGGEVDETEVTAFTNALGRETGALPPMHVVMDALREARSDDPAAVGDAVRRYYRRPRQLAES